MSATAEKLLGRKASTQELLELAGAPHGSTVEMLAYSERVTVKVKVKSGHSYWTIQARKDLDGKLNLEMPEIEIQRAKQGTGIGRGVFRRIIHQAQSLDFHRITLLAARDDRRAKPMFGYKVWPKFGFDGEIPDRFLAMLPKELQAAKTISDLYVTPGGREWWEKNGGSVRLAFDLKGDSLSWVIWRAYLATKGEVP